MDDDRRIETSECPLCGSSRRLATPYGRGPLRVVRCGECRVYCLSPRITAERMAEIYRDESYFEGDALGYSSYEILREAGAQPAKDVSAARPYPAPAEADRWRAARSGMRIRYFLDAARGFLTRRVGTEMAEGAAVAARRTSAEVQVGGLEELPAGEQFDLVAALHVIEHVYEPVAFVDRTLTHVKEGGHLLLATPDMGSLWRRLLGRAWPSFKYPEHVVLYDGETLASLLGRFPALADLRKVPYPHAFPLSEVLNKVGLPAPPVLDRAIVWIPGTTIALLGRYGTG